MARLVVLLFVFSGLLLDVAAITCTDGSDSTDACADETDATCVDAGKVCETDPADATSFFCCPTPPTTTSPGGTEETTAAATTTKKATTVANTCKDTATNCASYLDLCKNSAYQYMLNQKCAKSCKFCKVTGCVDAKTECADWDGKGFCKSSSYTDATKKAYCAKTCNKC